MDMILGVEIVQYGENGKDEEGEEEERKRLSSKERKAEETFIKIQKLRLS